MFNLLLLGSPRLECDGEPVRLDRRKAFALLTYLAVTAEPHPRDALTLLLWPRADQTGGLASLRSTLVTVRAIGKRYLAVDRERVGLKKDDSFQMDVDQFRRRLAQCREHGHGEAEVCPVCAGLLSEAVALYRGDFLAGFSLADSPEFDEWQRLQTETLRRELFGALERLVRYHAGRKEYERAIFFACRWVGLDPWHEPARRQMMELYAWSGQRSAALRQYQEYARLLREELGADPEETTTRLYRSIQQNRLTPPPARAFACGAQARRHNLPCQPTPFVGREQELAVLRQVLGNPSCRLLVLVGPGGIGKTRLALQAAAERVQEYRHGVYWISLAPLSSVEHVPWAIADALHFSFSGPRDPQVQLLDYLRDKEVLLLLDNLEHLLSTTPLLLDILQSAPAVRLLVTSRERLNLRWECAFDVPGLDLPQEGPGADIELSGAVQLFVNSARLVDPRFQLNAGDLLPVAHICQTLEGNPLAIELATSWVRRYSCAEIARQLQQSLPFLRTSWQDVTDRHRSLQAAFDHSWKLLSLEERGLFKKLSVFRGGFNFRAAAQVAGASAAVLASLQARSMLRPAGPRRYELLEVLRQYGEG